MPNMQRDPSSPVRYSDPTRETLPLEMTEGLSKEADDYRHDLGLLPEPAHNFQLIGSEGLKSHQGFSTLAYNYAWYAGHSLEKGPSTSEGESDSADRRTRFVARVISNYRSRKRGTVLEVSDPEPTFKTEIGSSLYAALGLTGLRVDAYFDRCAEAEPRLIRSIDKSEKQEEQSRPSVVLAQKGVPIGFVKASGLELGYVLDDTELDDGSQVPGDSFASVSYSPEAQAQIDAHLGAHPVIIDVNETPAELSFVRFSNNKLPVGLRSAQIATAVKSAPKLTENQQGALEFTPDSIRERLERF